MLLRKFVLPWCFFAVSGLAFAQEQLARFDAAVVVADYKARFQKLGDINGDGFVDAYSGWWNDDSYNVIRISAFINDGQGSLAKTWSQYVYVNPTGTSTWAFAVGDVNHDGRADLAVGVNSLVQIFVPGPGGAAPAWAPTWSGFGANVSGLAMLDVDGDGVLEIAVLHGDLSILRYNPAGGGSLNEIAQFPLNAPGGELQTADIDGSGRPGLVAWDASKVYLIPVHGGQPQTPTTFVHGCGDPKAAAGDLDGDGDTDVVVFDMGTYIILRRTGATTFEKEGPFTGGPARFLYDLNGDGFPDGVCCGGGGDPSPVHNDNPSIFRIALNDGTGHFGPAYEFPGLGSLRLAGAADLDHDGDLDLVAGRCIYYAPSKLLEGIPRALPFAPRPNALADLDCDKDPDLEPGLSTQRNQGDGTFATFTPMLPTPQAGRTWVGPGYPGDFDGDGDVDLVVVQKLNGVFERMELLKNAGGGSFVDAGAAGPPGVDFTYGWQSGPRARDVVAADADGDGDVDLVINGAPLAYSKIYWNDGQGFFTVGPDWYANMIIRRVADMNQDGLPDLIGYFHWYNGYDIAILAGLGNGAFSSGYEVYFSDTHTGMLDVFDIGDADGDGDLDIVGVNTEDLELFVNTGQPGGPMSFQFQLLLDKAVASTYDIARGAVFADIDHDGKLDILCWPESWYLGDAPNASILLRRKTDNSGYETISHQVMQPYAALDVDGDGDTDLIGSHAFKNRHFESTSGGMRRQLPGGIAGAGGVVPTLGASGPFRVGESAEIVLTGTAGAMHGLFHQYYIGNPPPPFTGGHAPGHIYGYYPSTPVTTTGALGEVGTGKWSLPFTVPGYIAGRTKVYQADLFDPAARGGIARTNKLVITYGP